MTTATRPRLGMTQKQFDGLHAELDKVRSTSATVKVDKDALAALLRDYAALLEFHRINP